jgi:hypothetical protein
MTKRKSFKPKETEFPEGEVVDSVAANLGDDKSSHDIAKEQTTSASGGAAWSPGTTGIQSAKPDLMDLWLRNRYTWH